MKKRKKILTISGIFVLIIFLSGVFIYGWQKKIIKLEQTLGSKDLKLFQLKQELSQLSLENESLNKIRQEQSEKLTEFKQDIEIKKDKRIDLVKEMKTLSEEKNKLESLLKELTLSMRRDLKLEQTPKQIQSLEQELADLNQERDKLYKNSQNIMEQLLKEKAKSYHYKMAFSYENKKQFKEAIKEYHEVLKIKPQEEYYVNRRLANIYQYGFGDTQKAEEYAEYLELEAAEEGKPLFEVIEGKDELLVKFNLMEHRLNEVKEEKSALAKKLNTLKKKSGEKGEEIKNKEQLLEKQLVQARQILREKERLIIELRQVQERLDEVIQEKEKVALMVTDSNKLAEEKRVFAAQISRLKEKNKQADEEKKGIKQFEKDKKILVQKLQKVQQELEDKEKIIVELNGTRQELKDVTETKESLGQKLAEIKQQLNKETIKFHYNLGLMYDGMGKYSEAVQEYKKVLALSPDDADTHYNLGVIYDDCIKNKNKAVYHYEKYLELYPDASDFYIVVSWIAKARKELEWQKALQ